MNELRENNITPNWELYEVTREQYKAFILQLKPEIRDVQMDYKSDGTIITDVYSNIRNIKLCSRVNNPVTESPEKYYIWELSNAEESQKYTPRRQVVLEDPEQVQILLNYIKEHRYD